MSARTETGDVLVARYRPCDGAEALALDAACTQGRGLRFSFRRPTFHRRAESYPEHVIWIARLEGALVGTLAVALKDACFHGRPCRAAFAFDLRVDPRARGRGVATLLARSGLAWAARRADLAYAYAAADNAAGARVCRLMGMTRAGGYACLACPTVAFAAPGAGMEPVSYGDAHASYVAAAGPRDFRADPAFEPRDEGYVGSWRVSTRDGAAGASAFCQRTILSEVVESVPAPVRVLRAAARTGLPWPARWPRVPDDGEELRSWYVFDAFSTGGVAGGQLLAQLARTARSQGIDWLHLLHAPGEPWVQSVRTQLPRFFSPLLRYDLLLRHFAGPVTPVERLQVDVRDV